MIEIGYLRSLYDSCVYYNYLKDCSFMYLVLYVDDRLIAAEKKSDIQKLNRVLSTKFEMKDLGAAKKILGMEICRDRRRNKLFLLLKGILLKYFIKVWNDYC